MDIKQEIEKLKTEQVKIQNRIAELETEVNKPMDCYFGEGWYYSMSGEMYPIKQAYSDDDYSQIRNKETAEKVAPLVQIQRALVNFKCEHDPVFEWGNKNWVVEHDGDKYSINYYACFNTLGSIWFSTEKLAKAALEMLKRRNLIQD